MLLTSASGAYPPSFQVLFIDDNLSRMCSFLILLILIYVFFPFSLVRFYRHAIINISLETSRRPITKA
jgi:hypothetical protein